MHLTILRSGLLAALVSAIVLGQNTRQFARPISPPDYMDNRSVDLARIAPERCTVELLNERMRVIRIQLPAGVRLPIHSHPPGLIVAVKDLALRIVGSTGSSTEVRLPAGDMKWVYGGV